MSDDRRIWGYWIKPDGSRVSVMGQFGHKEVLMAERHGIMFGDPVPDHLIDHYKTLHAAMREGWVAIRLTTPEHFYASYAYPGITLRAWSELTRILDEHKHCGHFSIEDIDRGSPHEDTGLYRQAKRRLAKAIVFPSGVPAADKYVHAVQPVSPTTTVRRGRRQRSASTRREVSVR